MQNNKILKFTLDLKFYLSSSILGLEPKPKFFPAASWSSRKQPNMEQVVKASPFHIHPMIVTVNVLN